jgi:hypothetical protein
MGAAEAKESRAMRLKRYVIEDFMIYDEYLS